MNVKVVGETPEDRRKRLIYTLRTTQWFTIGYLAKKFDVTDETVRRDLKVLEKDGLVETANAIDNGEKVNKEGVKSYAAVRLTLGKLTLKGKKSKSELSSLD